MAFIVTYAVKSSVSSLEHNTPLSVLCNLLHGIAWPRLSSSLCTHVSHIHCKGWKWTWSCIQQSSSWCLMHWMYRETLSFHIETETNLVSIVVDCYLLCLPVKWNILFACRPTSPPHPPPRCYDSHTIFHYSFVECFSNKGVDLSLHSIARFSLMDEHTGNCGCRHGMLVARVGWVACWEASWTDWAGNLLTLL